MSLTNLSLSALYNGVSTQAATVRNITQCSEQINMLSTIASGVQKRPPTQHVTKIKDTPIGNAYFHTINRDTTERYNVIITSGNIDVYDLAGNKMTVAYPEGTTYLTSSNPAEDFRLVTVADYTFIVNRKVIVEMEASTDADLNEPPLTRNFFENMRDNGEARPRGFAGLAYDIQMRYYNAQRQAGYKGTVQHFSDLPEDPVEGEVWQIRGQAEGTLNSYYVVRRNGVWEETVKPGVSNLIRSATMPHALVRLADGTFEFSSFAWKPRRVGDAASNPNPTFVDRHINDVFFYRNRLCFLSDESIVMSGASDFDNFYRNTVLDYIDSDVIDVAMITNEVSKLYHAVPMTKSLTLFSDQTQFALSVKDLLTAATVSVEPATRYESNLRCEPIGLGRDVYFVSEEATHSVVWEYFSSNEEVSFTAADITSHCRGYLPKGIVKLTGSATHNIMFALSELEPDTLYVYKYHWSGEDKVQSAWSKWKFDTATIRNMDFIGDELFIIAERNGQTVLEKLNMDVLNATSDVGFDVLIDRRIKTTGTYFPSINKTVFDLPYKLTDGYVQVVAGAGFGLTAGTLVDPASYSVSSDGLQLSVLGEYEMSTVYIGESYSSLYRFSPQYIKDRNNISITSGRLQLRTFTVYYEDTGYFQTSVAPYGISPQIDSIIPAKLADFTGRTLGDQELTLNTPTLSNGSYQFTVMGEATTAVVELVNPSYVPCRFYSAEWEGLYFRRS